MTPDSNVYSSLTKLIYDYQTILTGILAILGAIFTVIGILIAAHLPIRAQNKLKQEKEIRQCQYVKLTLQRYFRTLAIRARQAEGTIKVVIGANSNVTDTVRENTILKSHKIIDEWQFMMLLSENLFSKIMELQTEVDNHNFDIERAGGAFGAESFRRIIINRITKIKDFAHKLSEDVMKDQI